eukprot:TRINITY_DN10705_c0_g1_i1.p1 TRINITY_DN10705_c0_g1~~TRINITY_DN10705_c0_g1_i1.p1  ORF type:complete len:282 (+),score=30.23 TRINITY_DN10705_c0_g1_i1:239-1084(+)
MWSIPTRKVKHTVQAHSNVLTTTLLPDSSKLFSQGRDDTIKIWDVQASGLVNEKILSAETVGFCKCVTTKYQNSTLLAIPRHSTSKIGEIGIYNLISDETFLLHTTKDKTGMCMALSFFLMGEELLLIALYESGHLYFWDIGKRTLIGSSLASNCPPLHKEASLCFDVDILSDNVLRGVSGGADEQLTVWTFSAETGKCEIVGKVDLKSKGVAEVKIRYDKKIFVTAGWDAMVRVFSWKTLAPLANLDHHSDTVNCIALSDKDNLLLSGSKDKRIACWQIY